MAETKKKKKKGGNKLLIPPFQILDTSLYVAADSRQWHVMEKTKGGSFVRRTYPGDLLGVLKELRSRMTKKESIKDLDGILKAVKRYDRLLEDIVMAIVMEFDDAQIRELNLGTKK